MAVRAALEGRTFITPMLAGEVLDAMRRGPGQVVDQAQHSRCASGKYFVCSPRDSRRADGQKLNISQRTVEFHKYRMMETLGAKTSSDLITSPSNVHRRRLTRPLRHPPAESLRGRRVDACVDLQLGRA